MPSICGKTNAGISADDGVDGERAENRGEDDAADQRAVQVLHDFFEDEGDGGERSVKGSGQSGGGGRGGRAAATLFRDAEHAAQLRGDAAGDVHGGAFPAETHPAADVEQARRRI